jgi:proteasome lid subunit RPN8/RPN11
MKTTANAPKTGPDVKEMSARELPRDAFPGRGASAFRVFLDSNVHEQIRKHAAEDVSVEICGVLVGTWKRDDEGPYVLINAAIPGEAVANKLSEVTFTHETWAKIHKRMDAEFADRSIVGWYHTHPDFGIFLSERDCFIHEHFFREPGQVAYVVDPIRKEEGFFTWSSGKPVPAPHYWVGQNLRVAPPIEGDNREHRDRKMPISSNSAVAGERQARRSEPEPPPMGNWITGVLFGLCLFLLGFTLSKYFSGAERDRYIEANLTRYAIVKGLKPGLGTSLTSVSRDLGLLALASNQMAETLSHPSTQPVPHVANWNLLATRLAECEKKLENLRAVYALTPEEEEAIRKLDLSWLNPALGDETKAASSSQPSTSQPATGPAQQSKK